MVVLDEKVKVLNEVREALADLQRVEEEISFHRARTIRLVEKGLSLCLVDAEALKGVHYAIGAEKGLGTSAKNALWQEVVAALNRRKCVSNELAEELIKAEEWRIS